MVIVNVAAVPAVLLVFVPGEVVVALLLTGPCYLKMLLLLKELNGAVHVLAGVFR